MWQKTLLTKSVVFSFFFPLRISEATFLFSNFTMTFKASALILGDDNLRFRINNSIALTEYVKNLTLQIILGNAIRNPRNFQTFSFGYWSFVQSFFLNLVSWLDNLLFMFLLILTSDFSLLNLFRRSVNSLLMFVTVVSNLSL